MQRSECRGHDNPWNRHTEEECMVTWNAGIEWNNWNYMGLNEI